MKNNIKSGTILTDFSDHLTNFIAIPSRTTNVKEEFIYTRDFSKTKIQNFINVLSNLRWQNVMNCNDANKSYDIFWDYFNGLFNSYFPFKKKKIQ